MKRSLLCTIVFAGLWLMLSPQQAHAQYAYGYSDIGYDANAREVFGYSGTWLDYYAGYYYDPAVQGELYWQFDNEVPLDSGYAVGEADYYPAEVWTLTGVYRPQTTYSVYSNHFVIAYDYYSYCDGFYSGCYGDPYGFSFFSGGDYGGYPGYGFDPYYFVASQRYYLGSTGKSVTTPADNQCGTGSSFDSNGNPCPTPTPTPTPTPSCTSTTTTLGSFYGSDAGTNLNGQNRPALLGATVSLAANVVQGVPGTFTWSVAGNHTEQLSNNNTTDDIIWTAEGTYVVTVTFTPSNSAYCQSSATLNVNVIVPTLNSFTAQQSTERVTLGGGCSQIPLSAGATFSLGCNETSQGILFNASAQAPSNSISVPGESGLKFVQLVSPYRQRSTARGTECLTFRTTQTAFDTGWIGDEDDPYDPRPAATTHFNDQYSSSIAAGDTPGNPLESPLHYDKLIVDDRFEMYVLYYSGISGSSPGLTRPLGKVVWNWGGQVASNRSYAALHLTPSSPPSTIFSDPSTAQLRPHGPFKRLFESDWGKCPDCANPNPIDNSRTFVRQQYLDFYNREPDQGGWDFWASQIDDNCGYDILSSCVDTKRVQVAQAFFYSDEFIDLHPSLATSNRGSSDYNTGHAYNAEFVRQCYYVFLRRTCDPESCDPGGFGFWVNKLDSHIPNQDGDYSEMIKAFITSQEYRARFGPPN